MELSHSRLHHAAQARGLPGPRPMLPETVGLEAGSYSE